MYNQHFGLEKAPFKITPDTGMFFTGAGRGEVLEALVYAIVSGEGIIKVVGEVGTGKTMLCRMLESKLPSNVEIVYLANPSLTPEDILHAIALEMALDIEPGTNRVQVLHRIQQHLLEMYAGNRHVVVLVEEAQSMPTSTLEEIRLLSNLETRQDKLLQIVLFGQPELDEKLSDQAIRQLRDRITHSFYLDPLDPEEVREYVDFRLRGAGFRGRDAFRNGAYEMMARASEGLTRRVNILADKALLAAFAEDTHDVTRKHVRIAANDSQFARRRRWGWPEAAVGIGLVTISAVVAWALLGEWGDPAPPGPIAAAGGAAAFVSEVKADAPVVSGPAPATARASGTGEASPAPAADVEPAPPAAPEPAPPAPVVLATPDPLPDAGSVPVAGAPMPAAPAPAPAASAPRAGAPDPVARVAPVPAPPPVRAPSPPAVSQMAAPARTAPTRSTLAVSAAPSASSPAPAPGSAAPVPPAPVAVARAAPATDAPPAAAPTGGGVTGSLLQRRLDATREWLLHADRSHYSIQLLVTDVSRRESLETFLRARARASELDGIYVYRTDINGESRYGVLFREYPTFAEARDALERLPPELSRHRPFIRNVRDIAALG